MSRHRCSFSFERDLWKQDVMLIAGVDEVGRGPLAGPVTAGAVVFAPEARFRWLKRVNDSKQVLPDTREELAALIWEKALAAAVCFVSVETIDRIGIAEASRQAMLGALGDLGVVPDHLLLDAFPLRSCRLAQTPIIGGDGKSRSIAAASIIAKVARDRLMSAQDARYPEYGFGAHKGYYTPEHIRAIREIGPCELHRKSFEPVRSLLLGRQLKLLPEEAPAPVLSSV
ncbi:MAG TPA: ribonuclease HII [Dehalococcoidia bacterium]|nr:ribonuclease HII [Dehalococcoidia bacterium]